MNYPKPVMGITELQQMGFSAWYLRKVVHHRYAHKCVTKTGTARNSKVMIDTEEFEKLRQKGVFDGR